jgi:uncharacterized protein (DUF2236 family)
VVPDIARRLNGERLVLLGWGRAILLQFAHPLIAAGVHEHSSFRTTPLSAARRLHETIRAMLALTFGSDADRARAIDAILTIHRRVNGALPHAVGVFPAGTRYSAEDPDLVLWVHLTLLESILRVYGLFVEPISDAACDSYCADAAWAAEALGARPHEVPRTRADLDTAIRRVYAAGTVTVGAQARELAHAVLSPRIGLLVPPLAALNRLVTIGLLPADIRAQYGFVWDARRQARFERAIPRIRTLRHHVPDMLALWPEARREPVGDSR